MTKPAFGQTMRADVWWTSTVARLYRIIDFHRLLHVGGVSGSELFLRQLRLAVLFAGTVWRFAPQLVWTETGLVAAWLLFSPALLILWAPGGFRLTCYYYRGAYYKAFWADPPACTVGEPRKSYWGERSFPLIMQNVHRYFLYLALLFILILAYDVWKALWFVDPATGKSSFGIGVGTIVLAINVYLLSGYTFGCHSLRHLIGGFRDQLAKSPACYRAYACVSCLNRRHMLWAWMSLFWVGFTDLYVRLCAMGVWTDWRII